MISHTKAKKRCRLNILTFTNANFKYYANFIFFFALLEEEEKLLVNEYFSIITTVELPIFRIIII